MFPYTHIYIYIATWTCQRSCNRICRSIAVVDLEFIGAIYLIDGIQLADGFDSTTIGGGISSISSVVAYIYIFLYIYF